MGSSDKPTVEEALQLLGADRSLDAEALRRTYLRKVRTVRPDTDPEGFRRVREAYELLRPLAEAGVLGRAVVESPPVAIAEVEADEGDEQPGDVVRVELSPREPMGQARARADVWEALDVVDEDPERAASLVVGAIESAEQAERPEDLPGSGMVELALRLFVRGRPDLAGPPYARWVELLHEKRVLLHDLDSDVRWLMTATDELTSLWDKLPKPMTAALLAKALLARDPDLATPPLYELYKMFPTQWWDWHGDLTRSPALYQMFSFVLDRADFVEEFDSKSGGLALWITLITAAVLLVGLAAALDRWGPSHDERGAPEVTKPREFSGAILAVCREDAAFCPAANKIRRHADDGDCQEAARLARRLVAEVTSLEAEQPRLVEAVEAAEAELLARCRLPSAARGD